MKRISLLLTFAITLVLFQSCKDKGNSPMSAGLSNEAALEYIPSDAAMVGSMNMQSLMDKMDFESVKDMDFYKNMMGEMKDDRPELVYLMQDPTQSGIDLSSNVYMFSDMENVKDGNGYMGTVFNIKDATQFVEMLKKGNKNGDLVIEEKKGLKVVQIGNNAAIAFNDNTGIAVSGTLNMNGFQMDDDATETSGAADRAVEMFTKKPSEDITSNKKFSKSFTGSHDLFSFQSSSFASKMLNDDSEMLLQGFDITKEDLDKILSGELNPMMAFMGGQIKIDGDTSVAMNLQSLFS